MTDQRTYFEILGVDETISSEDAIQEAYNRAQIKWQTILNQGVGEQAQIARQIMDGDLQEAYETLSDSARRQQYKRTLELARERGENIAGAGAVQVKFSMGRGFGNYTFMVVENPIRHPLGVYGSININSIQEYICRSWEDSELGITTYADRSLERWIHYSAGASDISDAIKYFRWGGGSQGSQSTLLYQALDMLQTRFTVPILPRAPSNLLDELEAITQPTWEVLPRVISFGLIPQTQVSIPVVIKFWKRHPGTITVSTDNPILRLDTSSLNSNLQFSVSVDGSAFKRGDQLRGEIIIKSDIFGEKRIPVIGARHKMMGNRTLEQEISLQVAQAANAGQDYETAARTFRLAGATSEAQASELQIIRLAYQRHEWMRVVEKARQYHTRYGRQKETLVYLIEATRIVGASYYQLGHYERSLPYLASLAYESAHLPDRTVLQSSWTSSPDAQIRLNLDDPKFNWVTVAEELNLRWTHGEGSADQSKYAGPMPLDLKTRSIVWVTNVANYKPPIIAYEGMLVVRTKDNRAVVALDAASGRQIWQHTGGMTGKEIAEPVAGHSSVFIADSNGVVYSLNVLSGSVRWQKQLKDSRDLSLSLDGDLLCVGTGTQVIVLDAQNGTEVATTREMKGIFGGGANPVNLLVTEGCVLFQKAVFGKQSMTFLDTKTGVAIEYDIPYKLTPPVTWAAYEGEIYIPLLVTKEMRCKYRDSEGKVRERTEIVWKEVSFDAYSARGSQAISSISTPIGRYPTQQPGECSIYIKNVQQANSCAVAPVYIEQQGETTIISPPQEGKYLHRLIAAAFGRDVYYWISTEQSIAIASQRLVDSNVQSILFADVHDVVVSSTSLSTSLAGNTQDENTATYTLPETLRPIVGTPAIYGDVIFVVSRTGQIAAIGR